MNKEKFEPRSLKDVLEDFSRQKGVHKGLKKVRVEKIWKDHMGNYVNNYTQSVRLEGSTLTVAITNATLKQEMHYAIPAILEQLNQYLEGAPLKKMVIR